MSIILNALRSKKQPKEEGTAKEYSQGLVWGDKGAARHRHPPSKKVVVSLLVLLVLVGGTSLFLSRHSKIKRIASQVPVHAAKVIEQHKEVKIPMLAKKGKDLVATLETAKTLYMNQDYHEAGKLFEEALDMHPNSARVHNAIGLNYMKKKLFERGGDHLKVAVELDAKCAECYNNLGYYYTVSGEAELAEKYLKKSMALDAEYSDPYFNLGVLYEKYGDEGNARKLYREYLSRSAGKESEVSSKVRDHLLALEGQ